MAEAGIWPGARLRATRDRTARARGTGSGRLWAWLHAQALLQGTVGGPGGVAFVEDDRRRMAGRPGGSARH